MQLQISTTPEFENKLRSIVRQTVAEMMPQQQTIQPQVPEFLNLGEACKLLSVSRGTLDKLIKRGEIKVTHVNTAKRISKKQLIEFMASREV
ncbi:helix-turn-helix domain-containing protein [Lacticaseibacillus rhamnosus]|uniref:helix-turn-helix domain-containing protein n=1 Tax=Lacticaseibacillus rhamnosus TaxID=47715 RepID=UPI00254FDA70|nr:helix-turn-helix domain-containing protein [Lacticaseibacillus rhamnosus]MDK8384566.1 helix-turn-helix domain-containing protein [Lacticaseibacillus rhamnosus]MDK8749854.1 helix-turn-helix domain-containing protein [Lacticaseibacillus rhamnosus]